MHGRRSRFRPRHRQRAEDGDWAVRARVERFGEAALLALIAEGPTHGYELLERLPELLGGERVDVGNLYRILRSLEEEGVVTSEWRADLPGPAKRTYALTDQGRELLTAWLGALGELRGELDGFLDRFSGDANSRKGGEHVRT
jgi:PadR family transcriptional regulator, regulatory protein PadR